MQQVLEDTLIRAAKHVEDQLDSQLQRLDNLDEDDIEKLRRQRLEDMKRWASQLRPGAPCVFIPSAGRSGAVQHVIWADVLRRDSVGRCILSTGTIGLQDAAKAARVGCQGPWGV